MLRTAALELPSASMVALTTTATSRARPELIWNRPGDAFGRAADANWLMRPYLSQTKVSTPNILFTGEAIMIDGTDG